MRTFAIEQTITLLNAVEIIGNDPTVVRLRVQFPDLSHVLVAAMIDADGRAYFSRDTNPHAYSDEQREFIYDYARRARLVRQASDLAASLKRKLYAYRDAGERYGRVMSDAEYAADSRLFYKLPDLVVAAERRSRRRYIALQGTRRFAVMMVSPIINHNDAIVGATTELVTSFNSLAEAVDYCDLNRDAYGHDADSPHYYIKDQRLGINRDHDAHVHEFLREQNLMPYGDLYPNGERCEYVTADAIPF